MIKIILLTFSFLSLNVNAKCMLRMGWEPWAPYQYENGEGVITGSDIDLVKVVTSKMGCDIELSHRPWKRKLQDIEYGRADIMPGVSKSEERLSYALFSLPYRGEIMKLFVLENIARYYPYKNIHDYLKSGHTVGLNRGVFYGDDAEKSLRSERFSKQVFLYNTEKQKLKALMYGRIDGIIGVEESMIKLAEVTNQIKNIELHPMHIYEDNQYIMFSKQTVNPKFVERFNKLLKVELNK